MYKKTLFTLLLFLVPVAFIEQNNQDSSSEIINNEYIRIGNNNHPIDKFFETNEENSIEIKDCWEEGDLLSQKRYCLSNGEYFHSF